MNHRRKLLVALAVSVLAAPLVSLAQSKGKIWRVGFLYQNSHQSLLEVGRDQLFQQGMRELGYVEGKNLVIEWRFADGKAERLPGLAAELVALQVDALVTQGTGATGTAQKATTTIPIVFWSVGNPVASGFVKSLARPEGNMTGLTNISGELGPKHLEMLLSIAPNVSRLAVLVNPTNPSHPRYLKSVQTAAPKTGVTTVLALEARNPEEIENAFTRMTRENVGAVIVGPDNFYAQQGRQIAGLAAKHRLPAISVTGVYADFGGLMSYGQNVFDSYLRIATYVDKIFKGAKPADLPVEQPMRFELVINAKTAKALGLTIPQALRISADKVIE